MKRGHLLRKLVVSHPNNTNRIIYAHASDYADNVVAGQSIDGDSFLCYQGSTRAGFAHVHVEAGGSTTTGLAQDRDDSLARVSPYNLLYDYVSSSYK
ncbi:hypothetical protein [Acetanaerobacterium elongatum]|uniref:hypothetical protein n=1 Tax=Acetanaerobacterium elongatum TaxID=258515 RepID=UPI000B858A7D|nr:hypothetical protein [Acetanaerobacterium elongatum]